MRYRIGFVTVAALACVVAVALVMLFAAGPILAADDYQQMNTDGFGSGASMPEVTCSVVFNGLVFVGTRRNSGGCNIWRYDGTDWYPFVTDGFGDSKKGAWHLIYTPKKNSRNFHFGRRSRGREE